MIDSGTQAVRTVFRCSPHEALPKVLFAAPRRDGCWLRCAGVVRCQHPASDISRDQTANTRPVTCIACCLRHHQTLRSRRDGGRTRSVAFHGASEGDASRESSSGETALGVSRHSQSLQRFSPKYMAPSSYCQLAVLYFLSGSFVVVRFLFVGRLRRS